jgi:hypothetical protein
MFLTHDYETDIGSLNNRRQREQPHQSLTSAFSCNLAMDIQIRSYRELLTATNPSPSSHWRIILFTASGFWVRAQCVAATSPRVRFGIRESMFLDISGFSTESYFAWMKRTGCLIVFLSSRP